MPIRKGTRMPVLPEPLKSELVKKALNRAYELLSDRKRWAAGTIARDRFGRGVSATDPNAAQWCAVGAISRAAYEVCLERTDDLGAVSVDGAIKQVHGVVELLVRPVVVELANGLRPDLERWNQNHGNQGLPHFNDNPIWGYPVIIAAFAKASGNQLADSLASSSRLEPERAKCRVSTRIPALSLSTARTILVAAVKLPVSVQCGNSRLTKMPSGRARSQSRANRAVARARSGSGNWAMIRRAPSSAVASSTGMKLSGSSDGSMRNSSTSSTFSPVACSLALVSFISSRSCARLYRSSSGVTRVKRRLTYR